MLTAARGNTTCGRDAEGGRTIAARRRHASQKSKRPSSASQAAHEKPFLKAAGNEVCSTTSCCGVGRIAIDVGGDSVSVIMAAAP